MRLSKEGVCFACKCSDRIGWLDGANLPGDRSQSGHSVFSY
ncbi:hypothetical protein [Phormidium nigroviride]